GEEYKQGDRLKLLVMEVKKTTKGPQIILSRSHPNLVRKLFELEVPEIQTGVVEIYSVSREAGSRTKIAVYSKDENVDPLGACVGFKGSRVKVIVDELKD
ncbi:transcription termination/antitermination protein NusA, partial [Bacillus licheniformis]